MSANTLLWGLSAVLMLLTAACGLYLQDWLMVAVTLVAAMNFALACVRSARADRAPSSPAA
jgi:hypothetical protein